MVPNHNRLLKEGNGACLSVLRKRELLLRHRVNLEQNDRKSRFSPSRFLQKGFEDTANLHVKQQLYQGIPRAVCETFIRTRGGKNTRSWAFMTHVRYNKAL